MGDPRKWGGVMDGAGLGPAVHRRLTLRRLYEAVWMVCRYGFSHLPLLDAR